MLFALLIAGIVFFLAGLLGIAFGIPVKEFSFGNTEILAGVITACAGMIMLALWVVVRELKRAMQSLGLGAGSDIAATPLSFGTSGVIAANIDQTTTVTVTCTNAATYNVGLDAGAVTGSTIANRLMAGAAGTPVPPPA